MDGLPELYRRISRAIDAGRGIRLEAADVDLLVLVGAYDVIAAAAAAHLKEVAGKRVEARQKRKRADSGRGATHEEALEHLLEMAGKKKPR